MAADMIKKKAVEKTKNEKNNENSKVEEISEILKDGGVAIFPTDTVYGIGSLPVRDAVEKIYRIKKRDFSKKIIALIDRRENLTDYVDISKEELSGLSKVMDRYWPGELTIIFRAKRKFTEKFDEGLDTVGIRIPKSDITLKIIENAGGVILTTSANLSGENAATRICDINRDVTEKADYVFEAGEDCKLTGMPSTIVKYTDGEIEIVREGGISFSEIEKLMKR